MYGTRVMLSEISQKKRDRYRMISHMFDLKIYIIVSTKGQRQQKRRIFPQNYVCMQKTNSKSSINHSITIQIHLKNDKTEGTVHH